MVGLDVVEGPIVSNTNRADSIDVSSIPLSNIKDVLAACGASDNRHQANIIALKIYWDLKL